MIRIEDRFTRGFVAGIIGGIAMNVVSFISIMLNIVKITYADWGGKMIFGQKPRHAMESLVGLLGQTFFCGILGILFAYLILVVSAKNMVFKGWVFGLTCWFLLYSLAVLANLTDISILYLDTALSDIVTTSVYGISLGLVFKWLTRRESIT